MFECLQLIRPELRDLKPYSVGRNDFVDVIWLDHNESPWDSEFNRYPKPRPCKLIASLAKIYRILPTQLLLTRGSDEGIDYLIRLFCRSYEDEILICPPTFSMYSFYAKIQGVKVVEVSLQRGKNYDWDFEKIKQSVTSQTKIIFLCSPNNPTGNIIAPQDILDLCKAVSQTTIVVVDEAYIEFSKIQSISGFIDQYKNLVVLRTLSKAYGLAGIRCGAVLASAMLIEYLQRIMPPYPFSVLTIDVAMKGLMPQRLNQVQEQIETIREEKNRLIEALNKLPMVLKVWPSEANFILVQFEDTNRVWHECANQGIILRALPQDSLNDCLRISVGLPWQNQRLISVLNEMRVENESTKNTIS